MRKIFQREAFLEGEDDISESIAKRFRTTEPSTTLDIEGPVRVPLGAESTVADRFNQEFGVIALTLNNGYTLSKKESRLK